MYSIKRQRRLSQTKIESKEKNNKKGVQKNVPSFFVQNRKNSGIMIGT